MGEHWSNPKPDPIECPCRCGLVGTPRARSWQDGLGPHVRGCACRRCAGSRHRGKATRRESGIARRTGGQREPLSGALSGVDGRAGLWVWEETSNQDVVRGFKRWISSKGVTTKMSRMMKVSGVRHALILSWDGKPRWAIVPAEDWENKVKEGT